MDKKAGRNDPCPCGSGKKFKQCCMKHPAGRKKLTAKVIKSGVTKQEEKTKETPDLIKRAFGHAFASPIPKSIEEVKKAEE